MVKIIEFNATEQLPQVVHVIYTKNQHEDKGRRKWFQNITNTQIFIGIAVMIYLTAAISYLAFISITGIRVSNNTTEESSTEFVSKDIPIPIRIISLEVQNLSLVENGWRRQQEMASMHSKYRSPTLSSITQPPKVVPHFPNQRNMDSNGWADIGYNFLIGGDGYIFQGRGWDKLGAHVKSFNNLLKNYSKLEW
ncbi:hypothetical protein QE152_g4582 [Popillia japonica]|uniref:Uncharacterized protein n=1 Tax=Popillia japonica TaxID=7064 RepID=A0AAW1N0H6_POPJA